MTAPDCEPRLTAQRADVVRASVAGNMAAKELGCVAGRKLWLSRCPALSDIADSRSKCDNDLVRCHIRQSSAPTSSSKKPVSGETRTSMEVQYAAHTGTQACGCRSV